MEKEERMTDKIVPASPYAALTVDEPAPSLPSVADIPAPYVPVRLPCIVCGTDLIHNQADPYTGQTVPAMNLHEPSQPFCCQRCWWAAVDSAKAACGIVDLRDAREPSDEQAFEGALNALDYNETLARTLIEMAQHGYLGNSTRRG